MTCSEETSSSLSPSSVTVISKSTVFPSQPSTMEDLKLSVSDLPMLSCHYIQKGGLFTRPPLSSSALINLLKDGLATALTHFPALAGRFTTDSTGYVYITCNDAGVDFIHAIAKSVFIADILSPTDVPDVVKGFFSYNRTVNYEGHFQPLLAVQVTEMADSVFISCEVNHSVTDGTSFWNFFNTFAEICRGEKSITKSPGFSRNSVFMSSAVLKFPSDCPVLSSNEMVPLRERIFSFTREAMLEIKSRVNNRKFSNSATELLGKLRNDPSNYNDDGKMAVEISSFQSLYALIWKCVTNARKLNPDKMTTCRMAVNCRHRLEPKLDPLYFGNAIQSIPTFASVEDVLSKDLRWVAEQLNKNVKDHGNETIRKNVKEWESNPRIYPMGNFDGATITMGSSPHFPMYDNDFGWGRPIAVRSGLANKFDGKISTFPGPKGGGSIDVEVILAPETMAGLDADPKFMQFVSSC